MPSRKDHEEPQSIVKSLLESFLALRPALFRVVGRITAPEDIEDIVQETFVTSYAAARKREIENPGAYMLSTARNLALNLVNRKDYRLTDYLEDFDESQVDLSGESLDVLFQSREKFLLFCEAVAALPVACRRVFILQKVYGLPQKEIASYLGISLSAVEKHVARGMEVTAQHLIGKGYPIATGKGVRKTELREKGTSR